MRDILDLPADDDVEAIDRYACVEDFATRLRETRDFLGLVEELSPITAHLLDLRSLGLPKIIYSTCRSLLDQIETYVLSAGTDGELSTITAEWKDLREQYFNQYLSEHSGLHKNLRELNNDVLSSADYEFLENLSFVKGLSAHYSPDEVNGQLLELLKQIQVTQICNQELSALQTDLKNSWTCSECGYKLGKIHEFKSEKYLKMIRRGIKEYLDYLGGYADNIKDYVADHAEATPLLGLLEEPVSEKSKNFISDETMRYHLEQGLADATAVKVNIDDLLKKLKPHMIGFFKGGRSDFEKCVAEAVSELLRDEHIAEEDQPWKVE